MRVTEILSIFCISCIFGASSFVLPQSVEDHYWRDFTGLVPTDAIAGGVDAGGAVTYLGQFTTYAEYGFDKSDFHLIPATILKGNHTAAAAYNGRVVYGNYTSNNVKVFCGSYASRYRWYSPTSQFPSNCRFVVAGIEDDSPLYVGKVAKGKEFLTGKVFGDQSTHPKGLIVPYEGREEVYLDNFTILTYCI